MKIIPIYVQNTNLCTYMAMLYLQTNFKKCFSQERNYTYSKKNW